VPIGLDDNGAEDAVLVAAVMAAIGDGIEVVDVANDEDDALLLGADDNDGVNDDNGNNGGEGGD
jgi:hypothetical protein